MYLLKAFILPLVPDTSTVLLKSFSCIQLQLPVQGRGRSLKTYTLCHTHTDSLFEYKGQKQDF